MKSALFIVRFTSLYMNYAQSQHWFCRLVISAATEPGHTLCRAAVTMCYTPPQSEAFGVIQISPDKFGSC